MLAVLYDVHGNLPALEAVLDDARSQEARRFALGGDYALFGAWPAEVVDRLRGLDADWIRGNGERWTAAPEDAPGDPVVQGAIAACHEALGDTVVAQLAGLPETIADGTVEHRRLPYDHAASAAAVRERFDGEWTATISGRIEEARM